MQVTIRALTPDDRAVWEELFDGYAAFYKTSVTAQGRAQVWDWIFDDTNEFWCDLALDAALNPIGMTQYQLMHRSLSGQMVCYLSDLFVRPDVRGGGVGRALIDHVMAEQLRAFERNDFPRPNIATELGLDSAISTVYAVDAGAGILPLSLPHSLPLSLPHSPFPPPPLLQDAHTLQ